MEIPTSLQAPGLAFGREIALCDGRGTLIRCSETATSQLPHAKRSRAGSGCPPPVESVEVERTPPERSKPPAIGLQQHKKKENELITEEIITQPPEILFGSPVRLFQHPALTLDETVGDSRPRVQAYASHHLEYRSATRDATADEIHPATHL